MSRRRAQLLCLASALGIVSCAEKPLAPPIKVAAHSEKPAPAKPAATPVQPGRVTRIPLGDFFQHQQSGSALIIDVRPAFYYGMGHVPGALNWPRSSFNSKLAAFEPKIQSAATNGKPVFLYCTDLACPDALNVATRLAARGHSTAILQGGWEAWKTGELPIE